MAIPARLHHCWIGPALPWAYALAVLSAARRSGLDEVVLHHTDALAADDALAALRRAPGVRLARIDAAALLAGTGSALGLGDRLALLYRRLGDPVMRSDILRAAILYANGGLYADLDTVTVASLRPLLATGPFVASEFIVWPPAPRGRRSIPALLCALPRDLVRTACRLLPHGWRAFRSLERFYVRAVNNAVMGAERAAPLLADYLRAMVELPADRLAVRTALGPHLLAAVLRRHPDVTVQPPHMFSPFPPEISEHWFRAVRRPRLRRALRPGTRIVHWYASVRTGARLALIDPAYVHAHADRQLYSALVRQSLPDLPAPAAGG